MRRQRGYSTFPFGSKVKDCERRLYSEIKFCYLVEGNEFTICRIV